MSTIVNPNFRKAQRAQSKASILIQGLSGSGKSGLALMIGLTLSEDTGWDGVYGVDTENRSLDLFEGIRTHLGQPFGEFNKYDLVKAKGYAPSNYVAIKEAARNAGAKVFISDSITHAWQGKGGVLRLVSKFTAQSSKGNSYAAWGEPEVMDERDCIYELIRDADIHMISTVRVKEKFEMVTGEGLKSLGEQLQQMPDLKYEPDLVIEMIQAGTTTGQPPIGKIIKSRYAIFEKDATYEFDEATLNQLKEYLQEGADPEIMKEAQRQEYLLELKNILDNKPSKRTLWTILKEEQGLTDVPLDDMTLEQARRMFGLLVS